MKPIEMIDKVDKNIEDLNQNIQSITRMNFKLIIKEIEEVRGKVHIMDVLLTSERLEEIQDSTSHLANDICFDLDKVMDKLKIYLKKQKKAA